MKDNILITGITGFVGSHLADYIIENKFDCNLIGTKRWHLSNLKNIKHILDKINLSPLSSWHYLSYSWNFEYDLEGTFKKLNWRPKKSNIEMICDSYSWYIKNRDKIDKNKSSIHRSSVKQRFLRLIKLFL